MQLANKLIFNYIQEVQNYSGVRTPQEVHADVEKLDKEIDTYIEIAMKIKDRDLRKEIMEEISECKAKTFSVLEVLRGSVGKQVNNA